jgi:hypothetical protein
MTVEDIALVKRAMARAGAEDIAVGGKLVRALEEVVKSRLAAEQRQGAGWNDLSVRTPGWRRLW